MTPVEVQPMTRAVLLVVAVGILAAAPHPLRAEGPAEEMVEEMPIAGPPPVDDLQPPLSKEEKSRAAIQMLLLVSVSLVLVIFLLGWVAKANRDAVKKAREEQDEVQRTMDALERMSGEDHGGPGGGDAP